MANANALLDKKWVGGLYHMYNTNDTWEQWINEFEHSYEWPKDLSSKFISVIGKNERYIKNKNVIDLACNLGYFSLGCSNIGAKKVIGLEVRQPYIDAFNKVNQHWPLDNVSIFNVNIENINELSANLVGCDTVLYTGHLYHTVNHLPLLLAITQSSASSLIVESILPSTTKKKQESSRDHLNGFVDQFIEMVDVYAPSIDETKYLLESLGWKLIYTDIITDYTPNRFVITAIKPTGTI